TALRKGLITEDDIDKAVGNSLEGRFRLGEFDPSTPFDSISADIINCESARELNLQAAKEGVTLLKNNGILPLSKEKINKLLICGPNADENLRDWYTGYSDYEYSVLEGFKRSLGKDRLLYDNCYDIVAIRSKANGKYLTIDKNGNAVCSADTIGEREMFEYRDLDFDVQNIYSCTEKKYLTFTDNVKAETETVFRWFTTETIHRRDFGGYATFTSRTHDEVTIDEMGKLVCRPRSGMTDEKLFEIEIISKGTDRIAKLAAQSDAVIICTGNHPMQVARECYDRPDITLPKPQQELVKASYEANKNTVMLIVSSYPYAVNYENEVLPAIVYTSHAGPELGNAAAACIFGEYNPAGRTPMTWYTSIRELPDITDYDIIKNDMTYRYYKGKPLYPFGHGLSYSTFEYSGFKLTCLPDSDIITAELDIKNISARDGDEVAQIYFRAESNRIKRPIKQLCGFKRIHIPSGKTVHIKLDIPKSELEFWDVSRDKFCLETGDYTFMAGASSEDIRETAKLHIEGETVPPRNVRKHVKAINYDEKGTVKMLWSKKLSEHFMQSDGYTPYLIFQNCDTDGASLIELKASAWEKPETIRVYADNEKGTPIAEIPLPPTDGIDDFRTLTVPISPLSGEHNIIFELGGSSAMLEFKLM
ncbi:MAG: glycoside hydrolase family 3 C-terminal domain-containing protein, partial [Huintestinicola sp.]